MQVVRDMKTSRMFFIMAVTVHTLLPLVIGTGLFLTFIFIGGAAMHTGAADSTFHSGEAATKIVVAIGMATGIIAIGFAGQLLPCFATAVLLSLLASWLISISKILYVVIGTTIGGGAAALWFLVVMHGGLRGPGGMLTVFAIIGFFCSSLAVCSWEKV